MSIPKKRVLEHADIVGSTLRKELDRLLNALHLPDLPKEDGSAEVVVRIRVRYCGGSLGPVGERLYTKQVLDRTARFEFFADATGKL